MKAEAAVPGIAVRCDAIDRSCEQELRAVVLLTPVPLKTLAVLIICFLVSLIGLETCVHAAPIQGSTQTHSVKVRRPMGHLGRVGFQTVWVDVTRLGNDLSRPEEITVGSVSQGYDLDTFMTKAVIPAGQRSVSIELTDCFQRGYGQLLVVSNDGSISNVPRRGLLAVEFNNSNTVGVRAGDYVFYYLTSDTVIRSYIERQFITKNDGKFVEVAARKNVGVPSDPIPSFDELGVLINASAGPLADLTMADLVKKNQPTSPAYQALTTYKQIISGGLSDFPTTPVGLQIVDFVVTTAADLQDLATNYPDRVECLRKWVAMGGVLVVTSCGEQYDGLPSVLPNLTSHQKPALEVDRVQQWQVFSSPVDTSRLVARVKQVAPPVDEDANSYVYSYGYGLGKATWLQDIGGTSQLKRIVDRGKSLADKIREAEVPFAISNFGSGRIIAASSDLSSYQSSDWSLLLLNSFGEDHLTPYQSFGSRSAQFGAIHGLQVPDVGKPPKLTFLGLISLFAFTVGPVMFVWLNRINRLNLLLFFIPMFSLLSVLALVGYVIVADGFDFRSSQLSVTKLDSVNQVTSTQTIQAVYTGTTPGSYRFDRDTAFSTDTSDNIRNVTAQFEEDETDLSGGRIAVRTKHQITTLGSESSQSALVLKVKDAASNDLSKIDWDQPVVIRNDLEMPIRFLLLKTDTGLLMTENVAVGAEATLGDGENARVYCRDLASDIKRKTVNTNYWQANRYYNSGYSALELFDVAGRGNSQISEVGMVGQFWSNLQNFQRLEDMKPGQYMCICETSPWATKLKPDAVYTFQMHMVLGRVTLERGEAK